MMRSSVAFRKLKESLERRKFWGINPSSIAREHVNGSTSPPAALVGPSLPSVATLAKQACDENGRDATEIAHAAVFPDFFLRFRYRGESRRSHRQPGCTRPIG